MRVVGDGRDGRGGRGEGRVGGGEMRMVRERRREIEMGRRGGEGEGLDVLSALIEHGGMDDDEIATTIKDVCAPPSPPHATLPSLSPQ